MRGHLYVLSGPSGVGKGTTLREILKKVNNLTFSTSVTNRAPRAGEVHGVDYYFLSDEEFENIKKKNGFLEHVEKYGNKYGTPKFTIEQKLSSGMDVLLDIETVGALKVKRSFPEAVLIFITLRDVKKIEARLRQRGTDTEEQIQERLSLKKKEYESIDEYDYIVENEDLNECVEKVASIIVADRCRIKNNLDLVKVIKEI